MTSSFWNNRTAFVTGATGFVGSYVARMLVEQGARVVCLQRDEVRANSLDVFDLRRRVTVVNGTIEDHSLMERILAEYEIEAVFHLAAQAIVGAANRSPLSTFEANIRGTYFLMEACRRSETVKRVVVASSDKAYGSHDDLPYEEHYPLLGLFPYDASKACKDILARSFAHTYGTPVTVSRFANIYGPGDMNLSRIIPGTILAVLRGEAPIIRSDGTPVREFVHADDVARGYLLLAERSKTPPAKPSISARAIRCKCLIWSIASFGWRAKKVKSNLASCWITKSNARLTLNTCPQTKPNRGWAGERKSVWKTACARRLTGIVCILPTRYKLARFCSG